MNDYLGENLIFIISQPRAGSTLLQRLCANHPSIATSAEPWIMLHPLYALRETGITAEYNERHARNALLDFLTYNCDGVEAYYSCVREMSRILYGKAVKHSDKEYFLDKTPRYYLIIKELYNLFPKAKFIFLLRNPLSILASILSTWADGYWLQLSRNRLDLISAPELLLAGIELIGENALTVRYEELIRTPDRILADVFNYLNLPQQDHVCVDYQSVHISGRMGDNVGIKNASQPNDKSLEKWHKLSDSEQTRHFAYEYLQILGKATVINLGYDYEELLSRVSQLIRTREPIVPFNVALKDTGEISNLERKYVYRIMAYQNEKKKQKFGRKLIWNRLVAAGIKVFL